MAQVKAKHFLVALLFTSYVCLEVNTTPMDNVVKSQSHTHWMVQNSNIEKKLNLQKRSVESSVRRHKRFIEGLDRAADDQCVTQGTHILPQLHSATDFNNSYTFQNETKMSMGLAWLGKDKGIILVVVTEEMFIFAKTPSIFLSKDDGRTFQKWSHVVDPVDGQVMVKKDNGLQKHPTDPGRVYLVAHHQTPGKSWLYRSTDAGTSFQKFLMPFNLIGNFVFHTHEEKKDHILALESLGPGMMTGGGKLYVSTDGGESWKLIASQVINYKWGYTDATSTVPKDRVFYSHIEGQYHFMSPNQMSLSYTDNLGENSKVIRKNIFSFGVQGQFLYTSVHKEQDQTRRLMQVSTDGGATWTETQLPTITPDRFYSILDMSEEMIFIHVDNPGETGHGIIYTSDKMGVVFSDSLERHLYPNYEDFTDFYKVQSLRGVYIASQISDDNSIRTMITYDRGGHWQPVRRPAGVKCKDEVKECFLQIHNLYSISSGVRANPPFSSTAAPGIIMVHGHVAEALQTTPPSVYVSSDGGYNWIKALEGPHHYHIADQGGLLVAVPADTPYPKVLKFSTDEGRCWHEFSFTTENITFTGLLTEPGNQAMSVAIWGYGAEDRQWRVHSFDFTKVITRLCIDTDYETWEAHSDGANEGCLLGIKESFLRLKKDAICHNKGYIKERKTKISCKCTRDDYECDYGYKRDADDNCVKDAAFVGPEIDICLRGHEMKIITRGYRRLPGDECTSGFDPEGQRVDLHRQCLQDSKNDVLKDMGETPAAVTRSKHRGNMVVMGTVGVLIMITMIALTLFLVRRYRVLRTKNTAFQYSKLSSDNADDPLPNTHSSLYEDSSDEEPAVNQSAPGEPLSISADPIRFSVPVVPPTLPAPTFPPAQAPTYPCAQPTSPPTQPPVKSYHDESDEDLLQ